MSYMIIPRQSHSVPAVTNPKSTSQSRVFMNAILKQDAYLIHKAGDGPDQAAVFLSQEAISSLFLFESLAMTFPKEPQMLSGLLIRHMVDKKNCKHNADLNKHRNGLQRAGLKRVPHHKWVKYNTRYLIQCRMTNLVSSTP